MQTNKKKNHVLFPGGCFTLNCILKTQYRIIKVKFSCILLFLLTIFSPVQVCVEPGVVAKTLLAEVGRWCASDREKPPTGRLLAAAPLTELELKWPVRLLAL